MIESDDLPFAVNDEAESYRLDASCRKLRLDLSPEHGRELETNETVEYAACLLRIHKAHVYVAWIFDCVEDRCLRDFMENDTSGVFCLKAESLEKVP